MAYSEPAHTVATRPPGLLLAVLLLVIAAIGALGYRVIASPTSTGAPRVDVPSSGIRHALPGPGGAVVPRRPHSAPPREAERVFAGTQGGAFGEADGAVPDGTTVFDDAVPGVANLDPALLSAVRQAATATAADGLEFFVDSGWRSPRYQQQLLNEAVSKYGSMEEAERWVATPTTSAHVKGEAIDIGPSNAAAWLSEHGAQYGLCQIYANEPWHFELRPDAIDRGCPAMYADPTRDPRMER
jgi:zinc D-Ala-D-Ala carboxypeptidase